MKVNYTNYKGETRLRNIIINRLDFDQSPWHPHKQWLLYVWDMDKKDNRTFALKDCNFRIEEN